MPTVCLPTFVLYKEQVWTFLWGGGAEAVSLYSEVQVEQVWTCTGDGLGLCTVNRQGDTIENTIFPIGGSKEAPGTCAPFSAQFFKIFMQFSGKNGENNN